MTYDWIKYYPEPKFYERPVIAVQSHEYSLAFLKHDSIEAHYWNPRANYLNDPWSSFKLNIAFEWPAGTNVDKSVDPNAEGEVLTGFYFDQRLLALYTMNSKGFAYLRMFYYSPQEKEFLPLTQNGRESGHQLFAFENYPANT